MVRRHRWRAFAPIIILALTFSYTLVGALVPADVSQRLFVVTAIWAALGLAGHAALVRCTGRSLAAAWALPTAGWSALLTAVAVAAVTASIMWPPAHQSHIDLVRITIVGVVGEEVLFRGLVWDVTQTAAARGGRWPDFAALALTTVLFAVAHLQYDGFRLTAALAGQVGYALVAGVALGWARGKTGSLMPSILLHATGNAVLKLGALFL